MFIGTIENQVEFQNTGPTNSKTIIFRQTLKPQISRQALNFSYPDKL